jgi:hypothetical protein
MFHVNVIKEQTSKIKTKIQNAFFFYFHVVGTSLSVGLDHQRGVAPLNQKVTKSRRRMMGNGTKANARLFEVFNWGIKKLNEEYVCMRFMMCNQMFTSLL